MSFVRRQITISFSQGGITIQNLRCTVHVLYAGGMQMSTAVALIYGMTKAEMNQLSTLGQRVISYPDRNVTIQAGDAQNGMSQIFSGQITNAWADLQAAPNVVFHVEAQESVNQVKPSDKTTSATSYSGAVPVTQIVSDLAKKMGYTFENNGVNAVINNHYAFGSLRDQLLAAVKAAKAEFVVQNGTLAIWPPNGSRSGEIEVNASTGMVGAPAFTVAGVVVKKLFDVSINHGSKMTLTSEAVPVANGSWTINRIDYSLEALTPHGEWFATLYGANAGMVPE